VSVLTHFEILWGCSRAELSTASYETFLSKLDIDVTPLTQEDAVLAASKKPGKEKLVDALVAATVSRYDASTGRKTQWSRSVGPGGRTQLQDRKNRYPIA
jgi:predicted nucleic acid-binding protein